MVAQQRTTSTAPIFDEQAFLMFNLAKLAKVHHEVHSAQEPYKKLDLFKGDASYYLNYLLYREFRKDYPFLNLTPAQASTLKPKIAFYKQVVNPETNLAEDEFEIEFPILQNWSDVQGDSAFGKAPADRYGVTNFNLENSAVTSYVPDKTMIASLTVIANSMDAILKTRISKMTSKGKYYKYSLLDLCMQNKREDGTTEPPSISGQEIPEVPRISNTEPGGGATAGFFNTLVRVELSWGVGAEDSIPSAFNNTESKRGLQIFEAVKNCKMSYILYPTTNAINFAGRSSTISWTINFTGAIDIMARKSQASPFVSKEYIQKFNDLYKKVYTSYINNEIGQRGLEYELAILQETYNQQGLEQIIKDLLEPPAPMDSKIYQTWISQYAMEQFSSYGGEMPPTDENSVQATLASGQITEPIDFRTLEWRIKYNETGTTRLPYFEPVAALQETGTYSLQDLSTNAISTNTTGVEFENIQWFYLGDLFDVLMNNAFDTVDSSTPDKEVKYGSGFAERVRLLLSDIEIYDYASLDDTGEPRKVRLNLAHIPVSLKSFKKFFFEEILSIRGPTITIDDFIRLLLEKFIEKVFNDNSVRFNSKTTQPNVDIRYHTMFLPIINGSTDKFTKIGDTYSVIQRPASAEQSIKVMELMDSIYDKGGDYSLNGTNLEMNNNVYYLMIYQHRYDPTSMKGDEDLDYERAIPHVHLLSSQTSIGKVNFSKIEQTHRLADKIVNSPSTPVAALTSQYNLNLNVLFNKLFQVGTYIYVDPSGLGQLLGNPASISSYANLLGVGGYYIIQSIKTMVTDGELKCEIFASHEGTGADNLKNKQAIGITDPPPPEPTATTNQ